MRLVVLAHRWSVYLGTSFSLDGRKPPFDVLASPDDVCARWRTRRRSCALAPEKTIEYLEARGITVVLLGEVPPFAVDPGRCLARAIKRKESLERCSRPLEDVRRVLAVADTLLADAAKGHQGTELFFAHWTDVCRQPLPARDRWRLSLPRLQSPQSLGSRTARRDRHTAGSATAAGLALGHQRLPPSAPSARRPKYRRFSSSRIPAKASV